MFATFFSACNAEDTLVPGTSGEVSQVFRDTINSSISQMPPDLQRWLAEKGVDVVAGKYLTDIRPDLKGLTPRGYPQGSTWDMSEGLHHRGKVYLPEFKRYSGHFAKGETVERVQLTRVREVLHHEMGHAIDFFEGFTQSENFVETYEREKQALLSRNTPGNASCLAYFLQNGEAGRKEAFAELFSSLFNPQPSPEAQMLKIYFPETFAIVREDISKLGN